MKSYKQFLKEAPMTPTDALKVFGYSDFSFSSSELKSKYKQLAIKHHPDKGGDLALMQKVNSAYDLLAGNSNSILSPSSRESREERDRKAQLFAQVAMKAVDDKFDSHAFTNHFQLVFGEPFTVSITKGMPKPGAISNSIWFRAEFSNADRTTVLDLNISVDFVELYHSNALAPEDLGLTMLITTTILCNRRKVKLSQNNYVWNKDYKILANPESIFPKAKLEKNKAKDSNRKMAKRDVLLTFQKELGAKWDGKEWLTVPLTGEYSLYMWRSTMMGIAHWSINGLYFKSRRSHQFSALAYFYEDEDSINFLVDELKTIKGLDSEGALIHGIDAMVKTYKDKVKPIEKGFKEFV